MKIYVSIPISGRPLEDATRHAEKLKQELSAGGHEIITPFDVCPETDKPYAYYMGRDIEALLGCQAIVLGNGWENSRGCRLEEDAARIYELAVIQEEYLDMVDLKRMVYII